MSLPTPEDFDPTPYDIEDEELDDEGEGVGLSGHEPPDEAA